MQSAIHMKKDFVLEPSHKASKVPCAAEIFRRITAEFLLEEEANFTMLIIMMIMIMIMMIMMMMVMVMVVMLMMVMMVIVMMIIMKRKREMQNGIVTQPEVSTHLTTVSNCIKPM